MAGHAESAVSRARPNGDGGSSYRSERNAVLVLAIVGCAVACYLTAYQVGLVAAPWDPIFGASSSERVLRSSLSRALPVPDAGLGAVGYLVEIVLVAIGGANRWRIHPRLVLAYGIVVAGMALVSLGLVLAQAFVFHAGCALCLTSALISFVNFGLARGEGSASLGVIRGRSDSTDQHSQTTASPPRRKAA